MQSSGSCGDTSQYWRKLLKVDEPVPADFLDKTDSLLKYPRPLFNLAIEAIARTLAGLSCTGADNIPDPPFIIASNHSSILDFPAVHFCLPRRLREKTVAIYKARYDKNPVTRFFIRLFTKSLPVDMDKKPWDALSAAASVLRSGSCIYIAPEGTRSPNGEMLPFKAGVGTVAVETKSPVVPVFIKGADKVLPRGGVIPRKGKISLAFGRPIEMSGLFDKKHSLPAYEVYAEAAELIRNKIIELAF